MSANRAAQFRSVGRYSLAMLGPVGSAGAQFVLSLVLLRVLDQSGFGRFSFLLIASQLTWGIWSALVCAPLPVLLTSPDPALRAARDACLRSVNLYGAALACVLFATAGLALGEAPVTALVFAGYAATSLLRWFARAYAYAQGQPLRTTASDLVYSVTLLAGSLALAVAPGQAALLAWAIMFAAALIGMAPFGRAYLVRQFAQAAPAAMRDYPPIWHEHARWSLFGVLTTEATANAHSYIVTVLLGPPAFAPLAASTLMIRPINVAMNALTEFERAQMARQIGAGDIGAALGAVRFFRLALLAAWAATAGAIVVLLLFAPRLIFPPRYGLTFLAVAAGLWMLVSLVRLLRTPDSTLLQAAGAFRPLAFASFWSAGVSVAAVLAFLLAGGPLWSILGILAGEVVFAGFIWRQARVWLRGARASAA